MELASSEFLQLGVNMKYMIIQTGKVEMIVKSPDRNFTNNL